MMTMMNSHHFAAIIQDYAGSLLLRTGGFCLSTLLLPPCPCWRQLLHSD